MVHTHPTNVLKRPAQVVLDMKQKRRTTAQVKEDQACTEKEQEEQDQKAKQAIMQVAASSAESCHPAGEHIDDNEDEDSQVLGQRKHIQKTDHHNAVNAVRTAMQPSHPCAPDAARNGNKLMWVFFQLPIMLLLTGTTLFYWNLLHEFTSDLKKISSVSGWAQQVNTKIESTPFKAPLHLESASSLSHPTGSALSQVTHATTNATTTATAPPVTPESSVINNDVEIEDHTPDLADGPEHLAVYTLAKMGKPKHIQKSMDVIEVEDVSQPPTPPIPSQMRLLQHGLGSTCPHITWSEPKDVAVDPEGQEDSIMIVDDADDFDLEDYDASAATRNTGGNKRVTTLNIIYADNPSLMKYQIIPGGAVYHVVKQRLSEWHKGFGSATVMIITSLIASDTTYKTDQEHTKFAKFWLKDNRFLFSDVSSDDPEAWSGMWQSMFMLQTFAAHLNYTQGWMEIPAINSEDEIMRASLALLAGVVKRALYLLSVGLMSFTITAATGKGKKKAANTTCKGKASTSNGDIWEARPFSFGVSLSHFKDLLSVAVLRVKFCLTSRSCFRVPLKVVSFSHSPKSSPSPLWGYDTCMFMQAIKNIPSTVMEGIIQQAQQYMKATPHGGWSKGTDKPVEEEIDEEYVNLLAFC
ncbi:uncharacterized protein BJ212DRAFT_1482032 [Suillus subaureus]|uniref:Uncharacterized protein n=1 Tax=Suillus subaureus TaxID=48587 RepID=A0A9P7E8P6_9AGAM|nr:uncharacterized protein BJ212DRAFT_1482032 [Suillus subaureus]KAG1814298.1 hypothetical protein BJ212DRAFT_1482032 [Suillus subaureus]